GLDFDVEAGARLGVIGPNGGGKSTLIQIVAGLEDADAGELTSRRGLRLAYLPQQLDGDERDALATVLAANAQPDADWRAYALLSSVGLDHDLATPTRLLSGGQRKLVGLAVCLIQ